MVDFTIGCDPELFIKNLEGDFVSAHDWIPGTKEEPHKVPGGAIQVDGVALEFNTDPASSFFDFTKNIGLVLDNLYARVEGFMSDHMIVFEPTAHFDPDYFENLPETAKLLGCMPDYNAYTGEENIPPETTEPFRTAGGHIHIGWGNWLDPNDSTHFDMCREAVKQLDAVLYPASMLWDNDDKRRRLYGSRGAFRAKTYGVEYRPLSCAWLASDESIKYVYEQSLRAMDLLFNKGVKLYDN
jgi:hypothetical protein